MKSVSIKDARQHLAELVDSASRGSTTVITRRGKQVAILAPIPSESSSNLPDLAEFRQSIAIKGKSVSSTVIENRRNARY